MPARRYSGISRRGVTWLLACHDTTQKQRQTTSVAVFVLLVFYLLNSLVNYFCLGSVLHDRSNTIVACSLNRIHLANADNLSVTCFQYEIGAAVLCLLRSKRFSSVAFFFTIIGKREHLFNRLIIKPKLKLRLGWSTHPINDIKLINSTILFKNFKFSIVCCVYYLV